MGIAFLYSPHLHISSNMNQNNKYSYRAMRRKWTISPPHPPAHSRLPSPHPFLLHQHNLTIVIVFFSRSSTSPLTTAKMLPIRKTMPAARVVLAASILAGRSLAALIEWCRVPRQQTTAAEEEPA